MRIALALLLVSLPAAPETLESLSSFETVKVADGVVAFIAHQTQSPPRGAGALPRPRQHGGRRGGLRSGDEDADHGRSGRVLVRELLASISAQAKAAAARGESVEDARKKLELAALRKELTHGDAELEKELDAFVLDPGVPRAFREAKEGPLKDEN